MEVSFDEILKSFEETKNLTVHPIPPEGITYESCLKVPAVLAKEVKNRTALKNYIVEFYRKLRNKYPELIGFSLSSESYEYSVPVTCTENKVSKMTHGTEDKVYVIETKGNVSNHSFTVPELEVQRLGIQVNTSITFSNIFNEIHFIEVRN